MPKNNKSPADDVASAHKRILELEATCAALRNDLANLRDEKGLARDLEQTKALLQQTHDEHRFIFDSSPFGVSIIPTQNPNQRLFVNRRMAELFGYESVDEMLHDSAADSYVNPEDLARLRNSGTGAQFLSEMDTERYRKDGSRWWCRLIRRPATFEGQDVIVAWHADITVRKIAQDNLKASEARYASVVDSQSEFITRFRPDGTYSFVNEAFCGFTGKSEQEILKGSVFDHIPGPEIERIKAHYTSFSADTPVQESDIKLPRHDGELRDIEWRDTAYFDAQGEITEFQSVARDVTEQRLARSALELAKQQAQEANMAKSSFLATMSHEIRTPLNGVLGLAQLLGASHLDDDQRMKVDTILSSGQTLLAIINDVLDMSKIEAGGLEFEEMVFSLQDLVATVATPFQSLADDRGLKLRVSNLLKTDTLLVGDPVRLRQILWNLLSNAIKFTSKGGVTLTISEGDTGGDTIVHEKDCILNFAVQDSGTGIDADRVDSIFDAFTQEDNSITRKFGGTGLGLSIVKQLAELMGGSIHVKSELDVGTVFVVNLPFFRATPTQTGNFLTAQRDDDVSTMPAMNVIVAEDNAVNALIAREFLIKFGHRVKQAENGKIAVQLAAENWADIILMDIHMPEMDGIEATQIIRATATGALLPIIGLTAEAFSERHALFRQAGMNDVLTKPFTEKQLAQMLSKYTAKAGRPVPAGEASAPAPTTLSPGLETEPATGGGTDARSLDGDLSPIGDDDQLSQLGEQMGPELLATLLGQAKTSLQTRMHDLRTALHDGDAERITEAAHSIKGSSGSLFAVRVSELAAAIEADPSDFTVIKTRMPELEEAARDTISWWAGK
ncbi:MAG: PAS domain S-box protein [Rhodospirillales bacterium]|nr:PAS domain S-box protein [Rhodospirillales bacterium]